MGSCRNALPAGKRPPSDILLRTKLFNPRRTRATRSKTHSSGCMSVSSSKPKILLRGRERNRIPPFKPACSVDHGSNRKPRGAVRSQTEPCATPTVRFAPRTAPRRHGSVRGGREPPRFATVRRGSPRFAKPPQSTTVFHGSRYFFTRFSHPHKHIKSVFHLDLYSRKVFSLTVAL